MTIKNRILAVDDNPTNLAMIDEALHDKFNLRLVKDSNDALRVAARFLPDVILLDVMMPEVDGYEVCDRIRKHPVLRYCQIIMVSAKSELNDRLLGYHVGIDDYLTKPFDEVELFAKINAAIRNRTNHAKALSDLDSSFNSVVELLQTLGQLRRTESKEHIDRMKIYTMLLASELHNGSLAQQIDDGFIEGLYVASGLHDVGKIALPDLVLREFDPLTGTEQRRLQQHTILGERLLQPFTSMEAGGKLLRVAADVARWHHERFDGEGYPDGLSGNEIPLAARILHVADAFDSMTHGTVTAKNVDPLTARETIAAGRGTEFDPVIVDAFLNVYEEFAALCECEDFEEVNNLSVANA